VLTEYYIFKEKLLVAVDWILVAIDRWRAGSEPTGCVKYEKCSD